MASPINAEHLAPLELAVTDSLGCSAAQRSARLMAFSLGFPDSVAEEIVLAVAELASNLVKHAGSGMLTLRPVVTPPHGGIEIEATDRGPGIPDIEKSFADGYSTAGSLGYGLGSVNRLMDEVEISSTPGAGTRVSCRRWLHSQRLRETVNPWDAAVFTRALDHAPANGDAFIIRHSAEGLLTGVIDGLGHGEFAQRAALAAQQYVHSHCSQPLDKIFAGAARACRGTRGVVMALARFPSATQLQFASLGNIEVRAWCADTRINFALKRGILGVEDLNVHTQEFPWHPSWLLVLHTDGLRSRWQWSDFPAIEQQSAHQVASTLMRSLATDRDDATILAVRGRSS